MLKGQVSDDILTFTPQTILKDIFNHLGISDDIDWIQYPYQKIIHKNPEIQIPDSLRTVLNNLYMPLLDNLISRHNDIEAVKKIYMKYNNIQK